TARIDSDRPGIPQFILCQKCDFQVRASGKLQPRYSYVDKGGRSIPNADGFSPTIAAPKNFGTYEIVSRWKGVGKESACSTRFQKLLSRFRLSITFCKSRMMFPSPRLYAAIASGTLIALEPNRFIRFAKYCAAAGAAFSGLNRSSGDSR